MSARVISLGEYKVAWLASVQEEHQRTFDALVAAANKVNDEYAAFLASGEELDPETDAQYTKAIADYRDLIAGMWG